MLERKTKLKTIYFNDINLNFDQILNHPENSHIKIQVWRNHSSVQLKKPHLPRTQREQGGWK